jgi:hypothetical protein
MSADNQKIAELQKAVTEMQKTVAEMVEVLQRSSHQSGSIMKTSIPLTTTAQAFGRHAVKPHQKGRRPYGELRQFVDAEKPKQAREPIPLSALLKEGEEVTMFVYVGDTQISSERIRITLTSTFDGTNLNVKKCDAMPSMVGMKTQKPGEILYKFIDELKNAGHIKQAFSVAPWKLCFVYRDGAPITLNELRANMSKSS